MLPVLAMRQDGGGPGDGPLAMLLRWARQLLHDFATFGQAAHGPVETDAWVWREEDLDRLLDIDRE